MRRLKIDPSEFQPRILEGFISNEERYDLRNLGDIFLLPFRDLSKIGGKRLIGSAIRICKAIGKPEHAKKFNDIVGECFTPDEHQDPKHSARESFDLPVEPSTGEIQCDCCKQDV